MYPGSNYYDQNYQQQQYNAPPQQLSSGPGYPAGAPSIGFNVGKGMNQASYYTTGYGPSTYGSYNQYPNSSEQYMPQTSSYGPQSYPSHTSGPAAMQFPQNQCFLTNEPGYGDTNQQLYGQQTYDQQLHGQQLHGQQTYSSQTYGQQIHGQYIIPQTQSSIPNCPDYSFGYISQQIPTCNTSTNSISYVEKNLNLQIIVDSIGSSGETYRGTMKPYPNFNAEQDCNILKKAMKGLGTDEKSIIECLGRRNYLQRLEIKKTFKTMFGKDLLDELKSELSGNFSRAVIESLYDSDYYDAYSLFKAMEGAGTREDVLTEILTSRSNQQINKIRDIYKKYFKKDLEKEIINETSGFYKRVLVSCLQANKKELTGDEVMRLRQQGPTSVVNLNMAQQEAQELYNAGEKKIDTDEACFIKIFATRNKYQLRATFDEYQRISGRNIITSIEREMSGDLALALKAIAEQAINPAIYFARRLYSAMKGLGTNDTALIRIILSRSEIDLENIKNEFQKQYGKTLINFVREDTSGDYLKYLLRFVEGN